MIEPLLHRRSRRIRAGRTLPARVDLRPWCPPPATQGPLNACTAHAAVAALEFAQKQARGRFTPASRLFVYKVGRNLLMTSGDHGMYLRAALQALVLFGAPPEKYWPYDPARVEEEPPAFCYSLASDFRAVRYFRHDPPGISKARTLGRLKWHLAQGTPAVFGTLLFDSLVPVATTGYFPLPKRTESVIGAHAMLAVGYDDRIEPRCSPGAPQPSRTGAFLVMNSIGADWGRGGFGWLPYDYVLRDYATDWWSILHETWIDLAPFAEPSEAGS